MSRDLPDSIRRCVELYRRGLLTEHESAHRILNLFLDVESDDVIIDSFSHVPDLMIPRLQLELHKLASADYYMRTFAIGDPRSEDEIHADALALQPRLRRVCRLVRPLVLRRAAQ